MTLVEGAPVIPDAALRPQSARTRAWVWGALVPILAVAAFLRLSHPGIVEYRRDEANLSRLALSMARGESVPLLGIGSSIGAPNPPWSVWVFVPPYVAGNDPILATRYVGLLGVLAVLLLFLFAYRWFGPPIAVTAAALFACSPWATIWSRKIWAQDVIPFFVLLTLGTGVLGFLERRRWAQALFLPLLSITGQVYYATFVLIPVAAYLIWAGRKHVGRGFWIGAGVALLTVVPFVAGAIQAWDELPPGVAEEHLAAVHEARYVEPSTDVLLRLRDAWGGSGARAFVGGEAEAQVLDGAPDGEIGYETLGVLALISCAWIACRALTRGASRLDRTLALWVLVTPLAYAFTWTTVWIHYMIPVLPVGFLALGIGLRDLSRGVLFRVGGPTPWVATCSLLLLALCTVQVWSQTSILRWVGTYATPGGFGVPLGKRVQVRDDILARGPDRVVVTSQDDDVIEDGEAAIWDVLLSYGKDVSVFPAPLVVYPAAPCVVVNDQAATDRDVRVHRMRRTPPGRTPGPLAGDLTFLVGIRAGGYTPATAHTVVETAPFRCGARVVSYAWDEASSQLALAWRVDGPQEGTFHVEARLLDAQGREIGRMEARLSRGAHWRAGDTLLWRARPAGAAPLRVSSLQRVPPSRLDPRAIEVRLFTEAATRRPGARRGIALRGDPSSDHVTLKRP